MRGTVLVTGGKGFIGSYVVEQLAEMGYSVCVVDNRLKGGLYVRAHSINTGYTVTYHATRVERAPLRSWIDDGLIQHIVHLAAWSNIRESMYDPVRIYGDNVITTAHLLDGILYAAGHSKVKSIVFASSSAVVAPESHYGVSKLASEMMLDIFREQMREVNEDFAVANLRFANVYGARQNPVHGTLISSFIDCLFTGNRPQIYGDGEQTRDYIHAKDVADAIITAMEAGLSDTMNVSTGISTSVNEIYNIILTIAQNRSLGLLDAECVDALPGDKLTVDMPPSEALLDAGWSPEVDLITGILEQINWQLTMAGTWDNNHQINGMRA